MENLARINDTNVSTHKAAMIDISVARVDDKSDDGKSWEYINLNEYEFEIRQDERRKEFERRCAERARRRKIAEDKRKAFKRTIPFRIGGLLLIWLTIAMLKSGILYDDVIGGVDGTFACITIPMGLLTVFAPYSCEDNSDND